jgi:hypothetical protein
MEVIVGRFNGEVAIAPNAQDKTREWSLDHQQGEQHPHQPGKALVCPAHHTGLHVCSFLRHT